jgi:DNA polymerase
MTPLPPPALGSLPRGHQLVAGIGTSTVVADLDFETFCAAGFVWDEAGAKWAGPPGASKGQKGLGVVGAAAYSADPTCEVLCLAYDLKDGLGRRRWRPGLPLPADLFNHVRSGLPLEAWNVAFERWVWENVCTPRLGWPAVHPTQWRCAMAKARAHALPGKLDMVGKVLSLSVQKDADGKRLLDKFSMPRKPTKADPRQRIPPAWAAGHADHADTLRLADYNETDVVVEAEASSVIPDLPPDEFLFWQDDQEINHRGVAIDMDSVENCVAIINQAQARYGDEMHALTGCKPTELQQLKGWLHGRGVHLDSMDEDAIEAALKWNLPPEARRALEIRAVIGSASVKKVFAMRNQAHRGRLHDLYTYHGARTGRPTGNGPQPTNLPKAGPHVYRCGWHQGKPLAAGGCGRHHGAHTMWCHWCGKTTVRGPKDAAEWSPEAAEDALEAIGHRSLDWLQVLFGDAMLTIAGVLRGLFIAAPGYELVSSDFTAIEGVVIAALAGEKWRLDVYAGHGKMYEMSAAKILGISFDDMMAHRAATGQHHPARQNPGKIAELGLGFGGWINAWKQFDGPGTDDEIKANILAWRDASPAIVHLWGGQRGGPGHDRWAPRMFGLEGAAIEAVCSPGKRCAVDRLDGTPTGIAYMMRGDVLYCRVPSGGLITYHRPRVERAVEDWRGLSLSFEGWNTNPKSGPTGWLRMNTYSGKLAENVTQKVARDKQMYAIRRVQEHHYPVVMHTYDEIVAEVPVGSGSVEHLEQLMITPEPWNEGWPLKAAGGWRGRRYRKS